MKKYRRIEVNAYRRRVTIVSGEWRTGDAFEQQPADLVDEVSRAFRALVSEETNKLLDHNSPEEACYEGRKNQC